MIRFSSSEISNNLPLPLKSSDLLKSMYAADLSTVRECFIIDAY
jgi:hypothetical protein